MHTISDAAYKRLHKRRETFCIENEACAHKDQQHQTLLLRSHRDDQKHRLGFRWLICAMCCHHSQNWCHMKYRWKKRRRKKQMCHIFVYITTWVMLWQVWQWFTMPPPPKKKEIALCCQLPQGLAPTECFVFMAVFFFVRQWLDFRLETINTQKKMENNHTHVYFDCVLKQKTKTPVEDSEQLSVFGGKMVVNITDSTHFPPPSFPQPFFVLFFYPFNCCTNS